MDKNIRAYIRVSRTPQTNHGSLTWQGNGNRCLPQQERQGNAGKKTQTHYLSLSLVVSCLASLLCSYNLVAEPATIDVSQAQHIQFRRIPATQYRFNHNTLDINVKNSASFLLLPLKHKKTVRAVSFEWKLDKGRLNIRSANEETNRAGDDSIFKLGLMLAANSNTHLPFFAPMWLKKVDAALSFPSQEMIYIVAGAKHAAGEYWTNPYNKRIRMVAANNKALADGWSQASYRLETPATIVGLWLMSDGDNSGSAFSARVKNIRLE